MRRPVHPSPGRAGSPASEIRRPSSVAAGAARDRSGPWHAGRCRAEPQGAGLPSVARAARAGHRAAAPCHLVDADQMARAPRCLCLPCPQIRPSPGGPRDPRPRKRKSVKAVTADILSKLLATCRSDSLRDRRDRAILMVAFASGGRRRSEIAGLRLEQLQAEEPIPVDGAPPLPSLSIHLGRTKTSRADNDEVVYLSGRPVDALNVWLTLRRSRKAASSGPSIAGAISPGVRSIPRPSPTSSSSAPPWPVSIRGSSPPMAFVPAISPKPPIAAFRFPRPWSNPPSLRPAGERVLQQRHQTQRQGCAADGLKRALPSAHAGA